MAGCKIILFFLMNGGQAFRLNFLLGFGSRITYLDLRSIAVGKQLMNDSQKGMMKEGIKIIFGPKELWQFRLFFCFLDQVGLLEWKYKQGGSLCSYMHGSRLGTIILAKSEEF